MLPDKSSLRQLPKNRSGLGSPSLIATMRWPLRRAAFGANALGQPAQFVVFNHLAEPGAVEADKTSITPYLPVPPLLLYCVDLPNSAWSTYPPIPEATNSRIDPNNSQRASLPTSPIPSVPAFQTARSCITGDGTAITPGAAAALQPTAISATVTSMCVLDTAPGVRPPNLL